MPKQRNTYKIRILFFLLLSHNVFAQYLSEDGYQNYEQNKDTEANRNNEDISIIETDNQKQAGTPLERKIYIAGSDDNLYNMIDKIEAQKRANEIVVHFYFYEHDKFSYVTSLVTSFGVLKSVLFEYPHYFYKNKSEDPESIEYYVDNLIMISQDDVSSNNDNVSVDRSLNLDHKKEDTSGIDKTKVISSDRGGYKDYYEFNIPNNKHYKGNNITVYIDNNRNKQDKNIQINNKEIRLNDDLYDLNGKHYKGKDINVEVYQSPHSDVNNFNRNNGEYESQSYSYNYDIQENDINYKRKDINIDVLQPQYNYDNDLGKNRCKYKIPSDAYNYNEDNQESGEPNTPYNINYEGKYITVDEQPQQNVNELTKTHQEYKIPKDTYNYDESNENDKTNTLYGLNFMGTDIKNNLLQPWQGKENDFNTKITRYEKPCEFYNYNDDSRENDESTLFDVIYKGKDINALQPQYVYENDLSNKQREYKTPSCVSAYTDDKIDYGEPNVPKGINYKDINVNILPPQNGYGNDFDKNHREYKKTSETYTDNDDEQSKQNGKIYYECDYLNNDYKDINTDILNLATDHERVINEHDDNLKNSNPATTYSNIDNLDRPFQKQKDDVISLSKHTPVEKMNIKKGLDSIYADQRDAESIGDKLGHVPFNNFNDKEYSTYSSIETPTLSDRMGYDSESLLPKIHERGTYKSHDLQVEVAKPTQYKVDQNNVDISVGKVIEPFENAYSGSTNQPFDNMETAQDKIPCYTASEILNLGSENLERKPNNIPYHIHKKVFRPKGHFHVQFHLDDPFDDICEMGDCHPSVSQPSMAEANIVHAPITLPSEEANTGATLNIAPGIKSYKPFYSSKKQIHNPFDFKTKPRRTYAKPHESSQFNINLPPGAILGPHLHFNYNDKPSKIQLNKHFHPHLYSKPKTPTENICRKHMKQNIPKTVQDSSKSYYKSDNFKYNRYYSPQTVTLQTDAKGFYSSPKKLVLNKPSNDFVPKNYLSTCPTFECQNAEIRDSDSIKFFQPTFSNNPVQSKYTNFVPEIYSKSPSFMISSKNQPTVTILTRKTLHDQHPCRNFKSVPITSQIPQSTPKYGSLQQQGQYRISNPPTSLYSKGSYSVIPRINENLVYGQNPIINVNITPSISNIKVPCQYKSVANEVNNIYLKPKDVTTSPSVPWYESMPIGVSTYISPKQKPCGVKTKPLYICPKITNQIVNKGKYTPFSPQKVCDSSYLPPTSSQNDLQTLKYPKIHYFDSFRNSQSIQYHKTFNSHWPTFENTRPQYGKQSIPQKAVPCSEKPHAFQYGYSPGINQETITSFGQKPSVNQYNKAFDYYEGKLPGFKPKKPHSYFTYPCAFKKPHKHNYSKNVLRQLNKPCSQNQPLISNIKEIPGSFKRYNGISRCHPFQNNKGNALSCTNIPLILQNIRPSYRGQAPNIFTYPKSSYGGLYAPSAICQHLITDQLNNNYRNVNNLTSPHVCAKPKNLYVKDYNNNLFSIPCKNYITPGVVSKKNSRIQNSVGIKHLTASTNVNAKIWAGRENPTNNKPFIRNKEHENNAYTPSIYTKGNTKYTSGSFSYQNIPNLNAQYTRLYTPTPWTNIQNPSYMPHSTESPTLKENNDINKVPIPHLHLLHSQPVTALSYPIKAQPLISITPLNNVKSQNSIDQESAFETENPALYADKSWFETSAPFTTTPRYYRHKFSYSSPLKMHPKIENIYYKNINTQRPLKNISAKTTNGQSTYETQPLPQIIQYSKLNYPAMQEQKFPSTMNVLSFQPNNLQLISPFSNFKPCTHFDNHNNMKPSSYSPTQHTISSVMSKTQIYNNLNTKLNNNFTSSSVPYFNPYIPTYCRFPCRNSHIKTRTYKGNLPLRPSIQNSSYKSFIANYEIPYKPKLTYYPSKEAINYSRNTLTTSPILFNNPSIIDSKLPHHPKVLNNQIPDQYRKPKTFWSLFKNQNYSGLSKYDHPSFQNNIKQHSTSFNDQGPLVTESWPSPCQPYNPETNEQGWYVKVKSPNINTGTRPVDTSINGLNLINPFNFPNQQINSQRNNSSMIQYPCKKSYSSNTETFINKRPCKHMTYNSPCNLHVSQNPEIRTQATIQTYRPSLNIPKELGQWSYYSEYNVNNDRPSNENIPNYPYENILNTYKPEPCYTNFNENPQINNFQIPQLSINNIKDIYANEINKGIPNILPLRYFENNFDDPDPNSSDKLTVPLGRITVAKYNDQNRYIIKTGNPYVNLLAWKSKIKTLNANLVIQVNDCSAMNFLPVIQGPISVEAANKFAKDVITRTYGKPLVLEGDYSTYNPYAIVLNDGGSKNVLWPAQYII